MIGLLLGQVLGGAVMALHGAQGPRLGLPQMISSRVQFGVLGATLPLALVCVLYIGFNTTGTILSGQAIAQLTGLSPSAGILIFSAVIALFAACGYRMIHLLGRAAAVLGLIAFAYLFARLLSVNDITPLLRHRFAWDSFLLAVSLSASWQIAFDPTSPTTRATCPAAYRRCAPSMRGRRLGIGRADRDDAGRVRRRAGRPALRRPGSGLHRRQAPAA